MPLAGLDRPAPAGVQEWAFPATVAVPMNDDLGKLILRLTLGVLVGLHGFHKLVHGIAPIEAMVHNAGLPGFVAYGVLIGEVLGPVLVILGLYARIGAALIVINMGFAVALAHGQHLLALTSHGGWVLELQAMYLFTALALVLIGPGRFGINRL